MYDICIIGGGAAGLTAGICAKEENPGKKVLIIEKKNHVGKKIIASGNGKCNLTNTACRNYRDTLAFFNRLGVITRTDSEGRVYPHTEESRTVRDALYQHALEIGVEIIPSSEVMAITRTKNFSVELQNKTIECIKVLIATGGKAGPECGSTGDGFRFARKFGHNVRKLVPVLTAIDVKEDMTAMAGIRAKAEVTLEFEDREIFRDRGEVQFTKTGISGICVFNMSRYMLLPEGAGLETGFDDYKIYIDFFPEEIDMEGIISQRMDRGFTGDKLLQFLVRKAIGDRIMELSGGDVNSAIKLLKRFPLSPAGAKGWKFAQATKGGVPFDEIDSNTMESKIIHNLYFAGEVLDFDGPCGGYNLQNAWETGMRAGRSMASE